MPERFGLQRMIKLEVVVEGSEMPAVTDLFVSAGVTGYTSVAVTAGLGHSGPREGRLLFNDQASLVMLVTVTPFERAEPILEGLRTLFETQSGVVFASETYVSRPEYFTSREPDPRHHHAG